MKTNIILIITLCFATVFVNSFVAQTVGDYRSKGSGPWTTTSVWEYYNGSTWVTPSSAPSSSSENITIRSGHVVTLSEDNYIYVDQLVVESSAELQIPDVSWITVDDGTGENDVVVNGTLTLGGSVRGSGKVVINGICNWYYSVLYNLGSYSGISNTNFNISSSGSMNLTSSAEKLLVGGKIYNSGTITIPNGAGNFHGIEEAALHNQSGGVVDVKSDSKIYSSSLSGFWTSGFTLNNAGTIKKSAGSGTTTLERVTLTNTGTLQVQAGTVSIYYYATLNNTGTLQIANGASCSITGTSTGLSNFSSNTLSSGIYNIGGTFKFNSVSITTNNATIILDGASAQIVNESDVNALANFATNGATGSFTLKNGRDFSTGAATFTNNGTLDCGSNTFSGSGNFTNASGSTLIIGSPDGITSSGASGNIQSSGTRTFSTEANYTYNGSAAQVTGDGLPAQVNNFTINNSNGLSLTSNIAIAGTFTLTNGNINTGSSTLTLGTGTLTPGTLDRTSGTIIGNFKRWFTNSTVENVLFPVGIVSNYRPANISFTTAPSSGGTITASFTASNPGTAGLPVTDGSAAIENIGSDGYWTLTTSDGFAGGTYNLDLTADGFAGVSNYTELHLLKRTNSGSNWIIEGTHSVCTGSNSCPIIHRTGLTLFSEFGVGSTSANPLPVELVSFTADVSGNNVILNWQTATEVNNYGFEVERKMENGKRKMETADEVWEKIGFVNGSGNSNSPKSYSFADANPPSGNVQYRLKQIDFDGKFEYSDIVEVIIDTPTNFALEQNYPNPFNPSTIIKFDIPKEGKYVIRVFNILGEVVSVLADKEFSVGRYKVTFDASNLSSGIYFYQLIGNEKNFVKKMLMIK